MTELKPGPEMNALVATKVMGWRWCPQYYGWIRGDGDKGPYGSQGKSFNPSVSIVDAWSVLDRLDDEAYSVGRSKYPNRFICRMVSYKNVTRGYIECEADTPAEAICLAALKACGAL